MSARVDLLRWPLIGTLASPRVRLALQLTLLAVAVLIVVHGLAGSQIAPRNLATVLTWVHYRGLLVVALLAVGNLFCTACPMVLARDVARRAVHPAWRWPRRLRTKWPAIALLTGVLFTYELFDLWSLPAATAWLIVGYFAAAILVDTLFAGASFCKYVCPVGQFSFLTSMLSPTELQVRDRATCGTCRTVDCIRGRRDVAIDPIVPAPAPPRVVKRGCELALFMPTKVGNLDCTLCLDCVRACPHDNIGLMARIPGDEIADPRRRSGIGRLVHRGDIAALIVVFTFGGLLNAFAMTAPAGQVERWLMSAAAMGPAPALAALFAGGLVALPAGLLLIVAFTGRMLEASGRQPPFATEGPPLRSTIVRFAPVLLPVGVAIWTAHYAFHFLTGVLTAVPVVQSAAIDLTGRALFGEPLWTWTGMSPGSVAPVQLGILMLGAAGAIPTALRLASASGSRPRQATPWIALALALAAAAAWVLVQPMDMRGVGVAG